MHAMDYYACSFADFSFLPPVVYVNDLSAAGECSPCGIEDRPLLEKGGQSGLSTDYILSITGITCIYGWVQ